MVGYVRYNIPFVKPVFPSPSDISDDFVMIARSNWYTNFGPYEQEFRKRTAEFIGNNIGVCTTANATLALEIACRILFKNNTERREVLIPSFTFASGANTLFSLGLEPVFIDINEEWQPNIEQAETYIMQNKDRLAGILLCNTFGVGNPSVDKWEQLSEAHDIPLVIDSAAGFGSRYNKNEYMGARGDCEIFSLHATKPFAVGEGGLITSKNKDFIDLSRSLTNFGFNKERKIDHLGTNAKLQEINCAIGIRQLQILEDRLKTRQRLLSLYIEKLSPKGWTFQPNSQYSTVAFVSARVSSEQDANKIISRLIRKGVEVKQYYDPLHGQPLFKDTKRLSVEKTNEIASCIVCLPLHDDMTEETIEYIAGAAYEDD